MASCGAELTHYAVNEMLATRIRLMNELANLTQEVGTEGDADRDRLGFTNYLLLLLRGLPLWRLALSQRC